MTDVYYSQIEDVIAESIANEEMYDEHEVTGDGLGDDAIVTFGETYRVIDKGIIFVEGTYFNWNEETGVLEPDFSLTLIYEDVADEEFDYDNYLYFEQDGPEVAIHNFFGPYKNWRDKNEKESSYIERTYADVVCC